MTSRIFVLPASSNKFHDLRLVQCRLPLGDVTENVSTGDSCLMLEQCIVRILKSVELVGQILFMCK